MARATHTEVIGQGQMGVDIQVPVVPEDIAVALNSDTQVGISKFIRQMSEQLALPPGYTTEGDIVLAAPDNIEKGLFVPTGVNSRDIPNSFMGVIFPDTEFLAVAKSPTLLANHAEAKVRKSKQLSHHQDFVDKEASQKGRETLEEFLRKQFNVGESIDNELLALRAVYKATKAPERRRFTEQNWNHLRPIVDVAILRTVDVAARYHKWGSSKVGDVKRAVQYEMYGHPGHNNRRLANVQAYTLMTGHYTRARSKAVNRAIQNTQKALEKYSAPNNG